MTGSNEPLRVSAAEAERPVDGSASGRPGMTDAEDSASAGPGGSELADLGGTRVEQPAAPAAEDSSGDAREVEPASTSAVEYGGGSDGADGATSEGEPGGVAGAASEVTSDVEHDRTPDVADAETDDVPSGGTLEGEPGGVAGAASEVTSDVEHDRTPDVADAETDDVPSGEALEDEPGGVAGAASEVTSDVEHDRGPDVADAGRDDVPPDVGTDGVDDVTSERLAGATPEADDAGEVPEGATEALAGAAAAAPFEPAADGPIEQQLRDRVAALDGIEDEPLAVHAQRYDEVHAELQAALTEIDGESGG